MKREADCLPCVLDDLIGALDLLETDERISGEVVAKAKEFLEETFPDNRIPSYYITGVHRILKRVAGIELPFAELRDACNHVGIEVARLVEEETRGLPDSERFRMLCLWAVAGNHLDFRTVGAGYGFGAEQIRGMLREKVDDGFVVDEVEEIHGILLSSSRILYVPDNVGEIAFDRLLVLYLKEQGAVVEVPYRSGPITSDAMLPDFEAVGLDAAADLVYSAGPDTLGISFAEMSADLRAGIARADAVISKGQANFYAFHEHRTEVPAPVCSLLTTKCDLVSAQFGREGKINVAALIR